MRHPIFVRTLTTEERHHLEAGLRSRDAFVHRRCQILLASARGEKAIQIAQYLGCDDQTVRTALHAFNTHGLAALTPGSSRPKRINRMFDASACEHLRTIIHQSPRTFGKPTSVWSLELVAQVCFEQGRTPTRVTGETIRLTLKRFGITWQRAKQWMSSPDPAYARKKSAGIALAMTQPSWAVGFADEGWWSRFAHPALHTWRDHDQPLRLQELPRAHDDPDPKALAWYGLLVRRATTTNEQMLLRFVDGRPVSAITTSFLTWCCDRLAAAGTRVLVLVWDNASWHTSQAVRSWIRMHNRVVKQTGHGVRILVSFLPTKSPWLNPIEPKGMHGKRAVVEPARALIARELEARVYAYFGCPQEVHLSKSERVS